MSFTVATALATGSAASAGREIVTRLKEKLKQEPSWVSVFASTKQPLQEVLAVVSGAFPKACVVGASTAGEFTEQGDSKGAVAAFAVSGEMVVHASIGTGLEKDPEAAIKAALSGLPSSAEGYPLLTTVMLIDPLTGRGEEAALIAATLLGNDVPIVGGAAGDDLAMKATHVGLGNRTASDAVVLVKLFTKRPLGIGVCHGHRILSSPLTVTKAEGAVVYEIDSRPAWDIWVENTREAAMKEGLDPDALPDDAVSGFLLRYEASLPAGRGFTVRAPLSRGADGSLAFATGIPQGAEIRITESTGARQIESARRAAELAREAVGDPGVAGALVFDCICRNLILDDRFGLAVGQISEALGSVPIAGFETYGEIALSAGDMSGFHNTTTVVLAFPI